MDSAEVWPRLADSIVDTFSPLERATFRQLEQDAITAATLRLYAVGQDCQRPEQLDRAIQGHKKQADESLKKLLAKANAACPHLSEGFQMSLVLSVGRIEQAARGLMETRFRSLFGKSAAEWRKEQNFVPGPDPASDLAESLGLIALVIIGIAFIVGISLALAG